MKTFARLIRRYVLATAGIILVVVALLLGMTIYAGVRYNGASDSVQKVGALAEALHPTADGLQWDAAHTPAEWMHGYAWAMVLDEDGNVIWQQDLPEALNHRYTASDIAVFSRWYLADYPVQCWAADYGLFVAAEPVGSQWKYNITAPQARMEAMVGGLLPVAVLLLAVVLGCCLWFSWRGARHLQAVADGLDTLAQGGAVQRPAAAGHRKPFAQHCRPQCSPRACHRPGGCGGRHADHPGDRRWPGLPARRAGRIADWRNRGESPAHFRPACGRADPSRPRRHRRFCPSPAPRRGRCFDPAAVKIKRPLPENSDRGRAIYKLGAVG